MRISRKAVIVAVVATMLVSTVAVAGALINGSSGQLQLLASPPASVAVNATEDATRAIAFDERQGVTLTKGIAIDAVNPGTYKNFPNGTRKIAPGNVVDSHLIHSDPTAGSTTMRRQGTVTFASDILGVIGDTGRLAASDSALGAPGTTYAGTREFRGFEKDGTVTTADSFTISANRRSVTFDVRTTSVIDEIRVVTAYVDSLSTTISDSPDPVTAGNDVQYTLVVTNTGYSSVANAHVVQTLPSGTTVVSKDAPGGCTGTGPVDCSLGALGVGASATAHVVVTTPATVPEGGTMTTTAVASPGANATASETTTVEEPEPGVSKGFVSPGGSIDIDGDDPAELTLPNTGNGAPVIITQGAGTFCNGPCVDTTTEISSFPGYSDPNNPIHLTLTYTFPDSPTSLTDAATAFGSTIYKNDDPENPGTGVPVANCASPGIATPHPCVDGHTIVQPTPNSFVVTFEILYLSGDPRFGRR